MPTKRTPSGATAKRMQFSDVAVTVTFADVRAVLDKVAANANQPISNSPHGTFWRTDRNSFVGQYVNMTDPLNSTFYIYLARGVMPLGGPQTDQADLDVIKSWLSTGFH